MTSACSRLPCRIDLKNQLQRVDQQIVVQRLFKKSQCARSKRLFANASVVRRGNEDNGNIRSLATEVLLHLETVQARHMHVENHAVPAYGWPRSEQIEEFQTRSECIGSDAP